MAPTRIAVSLAAVCLLSFQGASFSQTTPVQSAAVLEVQRLGPHLVSFAGTQANFANLVNGLATGTAVTLTTSLPDGRLQTTNFTPTAAFNSVDIARALELARQDLIMRGIGTPSGEQIGLALMGGPLATPTGTVPLSGVLMQGTAAAVPSATAAGAAAVVPERSRVAVSVSPGGATQPIVDAPLATPVQGTAPTTLTPATTTTTPGASTGTSATPAQRFTSDSLTIGTSNSPVPPTTTAPNGAPSPAVQLQNRR